MPQIRNRHLFICDAVTLLCVPTVAYLLRFEGWGWTGPDTHALVSYTLLAVPAKLTLFLALGLYNRLWSRASVEDLIQIVMAAAVSAAGGVLLGAVVLPGTGLTIVRVPLSVLFLDALATIAMVAGPRLLTKALRAHHVSRASDAATLIVGAGAAGEVLAKELMSNPDLRLRPVGFLDDDPLKRRLRLCGLPVLGFINEMPGVVAARKVTEVIIAMPRARGATVRRVMKAAAAAGVRTRTVPGLFEIVSGRVSVTALRKVEIQDLLRREPVATDLEPVRGLLAGRCVLVTGAGGSIGSELCRQLAGLAPARMLLVGHGENSIFTIQSELRTLYPALVTVPIIADVRDGVRMQNILATHRPDTVFHAAAHKHVPLMEGNIAEAVLNNVLGTMSMVTAAAEAGTEHFVLISTDKAVQPCSVMGATKRVAEMVVQQAAAASGRHYVAVRFGNVLGSRGSVVPTFLQQIEAGGPVTVTHPDMRRYFMTIPEAVQLVLQAAALGDRGEVFVLDMGAPVRIVDLACDLIRLSGLEPGQDIEVQFTGARPGERLSEEVLIAGEQVAPTLHPKVLRATNRHLPADVDLRIWELIQAAQAWQPDGRLRELMRGLVPEASLAEAAAPPLTAMPQGLEDVDLDAAFAGGLAEAAESHRRNGSASAANGNGREQHAPAEPAARAAW
jgi:FlaA1/EpsC-like NDP-sugar epimerase